jgi:hypothetical protein
MEAGLDSSCIRPTGEHRLRYTRHDQPRIATTRRLFEYSYACPFRRVPDARWQRLRACTYELDDRSLGGPFPQHRFHSRLNFGWGGDVSGAAGKG